MKTIFALATAPGRAAVAVIRISGPDAFDAAARIGAVVDPDRRMRLRRLHDPSSGALLDEALVVGFLAGGSFTGEASVELHLHGSSAVVRAVLGVLGEDPALTPAAPGEFTRQALDNAKLDLPQVEALADLIDAETEAQRKQALHGLGGALVRAAEGYRTALRDARALIEAGIDFADEDIADGTLEAGLADVASVRAALLAEVAGAAAAAQIRDGFTVALVGPPNAGKSSLLNALARREVALVSDIPGTTRDVLEARCEIGGQLVTLLDTAGLREGGDVIEQLGMARARERAGMADLRLHVSAPGLPASSQDWQCGDIAVAAKADLGEAEGLPVSAVTGAGLAHLVAAIERSIGGRTTGAGLAAHARHRRALSEAAAALDMPADVAPEVAAEQVRVAMRALDGLIGRIDIEEVLGAIFARFCIGK
jgi:tRNA modification GTPase